MKTPEYVNSNLTPREAFNFHGTLPPAMIEKLIDDLEDAQIDITPICDAVEQLRLAEVLLEDIISDYDTDGECSTRDFEKLASLIHKAQFELEKVPT